MISLTSPLRNKWLALAILAGLLLTLTTCGYCRERRRSTKLQERVDVARAELAGANAALAVKPSEVVKLVEKEVPVEVVKLVKERVLVPVASGTVETSTQTVQVPLTNLEPTQQVLDVDVRLKGWFLLTTTKGGNPFWNGELTAVLSRNDWSKDVVFNRDNSTVEMRVSTEITDALHAHMSERRFALGLRPVKQWRTGWSAGGGLAYDPIDQRFAPVVAVTWGVQF